jgi:predicted transcriptional regulator
LKEHDPFTVIFLLGFMEANTLSIPEEQLSSALKMSKSTITRRCAELYKAGLPEKLSHSSVDLQPLTIDREMAKKFEQEKKIE